MKKKNFIIETIGTWGIIIEIDNAVGYTSECQRRQIRIQKIMDDGHVQFVSHFFIVEKKAQCPIFRKQRHVMPLTVRYLTILDAHVHHDARSESWIILQHSVSQLHGQNLKFKMNRIVLKITND